MNTPTEEELDRAGEEIRRWHRGLDEVTSTLREKLAPLPGFRTAEVDTEGEDEFRAYIFFETDSQAENRREGNFAAKLEETLRQELQKVGRGTTAEMKISVEIDSHENVERNYRGSYFLRMR